LAQERRRAKDLLKAVRSGDSAAIARLRSQHPRLAALLPGKLAADVQLSDAQLVIAREYGFASWPSLKIHIEQASGRPPGRPPYSVLIWSDETTPTEFVVLMLKKVFGRNEEDAERIWLDAYRSRLPALMVGEHGVRGDRLTTRGVRTAVLDNNERNEK
jgi:hypothetical protein